MMGIPFKAEVHLETARMALELSHKSKSRRPGYVAPEVSDLCAEVSTLRAAVDALLAALDIMALDPAPREPVFTSSVRHEVGAFRALLVDPDIDVQHVEDLVRTDQPANDQGDLYQALLGVEDIGYGNGVSVGWRQDDEDSVRTNYVILHKASFVRTLNQQLLANRHMAILMVRQSGEITGLFIQQPKLNHDVEISRDWFRLRQAFGIKINALDEIQMIFQKDVPA